MARRRLYCPGPMAPRTDLKRALHLNYADHHVAGEWFRLTEESSVTDVPG